MKFKLLAIAAVLAASGVANAATFSSGADGNGGLFFSIWDANNSYSLNLGTTIDGFQSTVAGSGLVDLSWAADATFTSFLSTADVASLKWNVVATDVAGARRLLETFTAPAPSPTVDNSLVRSVAAAASGFAGAVNNSLATANSAIYAVGGQGTGYAGQPAFDTVNLGFSNVGSVANNSYASGLNFMRIDALATGLLKSVNTSYADNGTAVKVYLDGSNALHIAAVAAVPEPENFAMLLAGLGLMGAIARRRNKKSV